MKFLAVVTGANTGIGYEIARSLATSQFRVIIGARDAEKGNSAAEAIRASGGDAVFISPLDITVPSSVEKFAAAIAEQNLPLALLINNAGLAFKGDAFSAGEARVTIDTNFYGTLRVTEALLPMLRKHGKGARIINVCSVAGRLNQVALPLQARFSAPDATPASLSALMTEFTRAVEADNYKELGWPRSMYGVSKLGEIALTMAFSRDLMNDGIIVNACCPGYCATAMSSFRGHKTPQQGADTPVWLATRNGKVSQELTGGFYQERKSLQW